MATMYSFSRALDDGDEAKEAFDVGVSECADSVHRSALVSPASYSSEMHFLKTHEKGVQEVMEK